MKKSTRKMVLTLLSYAIIVAGVKAQTGISSLLLKKEAPLEVFEPEIDSLMRDANKDNSYHYLKNHDDYEKMLNYLDPYAANEDKEIRYRYYTWISDIGEKSKSYRSEALLRMLRGIGDCDAKISEMCSRFRMCENDFGSQADSIVSDLFYKQLDVFYYENEWANHPDMKVRDSCRRVQSNRFGCIHHNVVRLAGFAQITALIPDMKKAAAAYEDSLVHSWMEVSFPRSQVEGDVGDGSRITTKWELNLAMAHMGDTAAINYCCSEVLKLARDNNPSSYWDYMKDLVYIMQPQVVDVYLEMLTWKKEYYKYVDYESLISRCLRQLIEGWPYFGDGERNKQINWLNENRGSYILIRDNALDVIF